MSKVRVQDGCTRKTAPLGLGFRVWFRVGCLGFRVKGLGNLLRGLG